MILASHGRDGCPITDNWMFAQQRNHQTSMAMNSSLPSATYMRRWIGSAFIQIMTCRLFGAKPLSSQCWVIVNLTLRNNFSDILFSIQNLLFMKIHSKFLFVKWCHFAHFGLMRAKHDDVINWKHFPRYWSFVRGILRSLVRRNFDVFFDLRLE